MSLGEDRRVAEVSGEDQESQQERFRALMEGTGQGSGVGIDDSVLLFIFFFSSGIESRAFTLNYIPNPFFMFYLETRPDQVAKLPRLGSNL